MGLRTFLAIDLPDSLRSTFERNLQRFKRKIRGPSAEGPAGVSWVHQENLHVTVKFFGETTDVQISEMYQVVKPVVAACSPFDVELRGCGVFPDARRPRTLWTGIGGDVDALTALVTQIDQAVMSVGFPSDLRASQSEGQPFRPHLTVARVKKNHRRVGEMLEAAGAFTDALDFGRFRVERVTLFRSDRQPGGSVYTPLWDVAFAGHGRAQPNHRSHA